MAKTAARIQGIAIAPGISRNQRLYTSEAIAKMVARAQDRITSESGLPIAMATHHDAASDSTKIVGKISSMTLDESGAAHFIADIAATKTGRTVAKLVKGGYLKGVSIRGAWVGKTRTERGPARMGARATRQAPVEAFDRVARAEDDSWRAALHAELRLNLNLDSESDPERVWSFDTRVLDDSLSHAGAFSDEVLQRIIWARRLSLQTRDAINYYREAQGSERMWAQEQARKLRKDLLGEIVTLEQQLRRG